MDNNFKCTRCGKKLPHQGAYLKVDTGMCSESMGLCMDCYNSYFDWRMGRESSRKNMVYSTLIF